jgi:hypothetical protein
MRFRWGYIIFLSVYLLSCQEVDQSLQTRPGSFGKLNQITVIADEYIWDGIVGDTFSYYFESPYPIMPSPEPIFDLRFFTAQQIKADELRRQLRTYVVLADLSKSDSPTTRMIREDFGAEKFEKALNDPSFNSLLGQDKWARDQVIIYLFGNGEQALIESIVTNFPAAATRINRHDESQLESNIYAVRKNDIGIQNDILTLYNLEMSIPADYKRVMLDKENYFLWLRKDTKEDILNILFTKVPYEGTQQFDRDSIIALRDRLGKTYISSDIEESYMKTNIVDLPIQEQVFKLGGEAYTKEIRGIWEMENDYKGGPYFSYLIHNEKAAELVFIDAFIFAPGKSKRNFMQQMEFIIKKSKLR